jgi:NADH:quinone reductase (non-electrogenic)
MRSTARKRILVLGGGFGGIYTVRALHKALHGRTDIEIALVNQENYFVFQPMLAEVISSNIGLLNTVTPIRDLCPGATLYVRTVERIDLDNKVVITSHGFRPGPSVLPYDYLVLALGTLENFGVVRGLQEHGLHFKNLGDALVLRNRLIHLLEEADSEPDAALRRRMLTFVMAGGGFSGVEAIAEVNDFVRDVARRYPHVDPAELRVILVHAGQRILPELPASLSRYAQTMLTRRKVEIRLQTRLAAVTADEAHLTDGSALPTKTVIATIGATPNPVLLALPCQKERGRLVVNAALEVPDYPGVWALGDCAHILDHTTGQPCPPTAQYAVREGMRVARNIVAAIEGTTPRPFAFSDWGMMSALGHRAAVGQVLGIQVSGWPAWVLWRAVYWSKLPGVTRKVRIALDWFCRVLLPRDYAQLNASPSDRIARAHFEAGEVIVRQGEPGDCMYVMIDGEVDVVQQQAEGGERVVATLTQGAWFGEMALFNEEPRSATVRTRTTVNVLSVDRRTFQTLVAHIAPLREAFERLMQHREAEDKARHQQHEEEGLRPAPTQSRQQVVF